MYQQPRSIDIVIESSKRVNGSHNNFEYATNFPIPKEGKTIRLNKAIIPFTYFNVNSSNNVIGVRVTASSTVVSYTVTPGCYSPSQLATAIQTALAADTFSVFTVTYNANTFQYTISANNAVYQGVDGTSTILNVIGLTGSSLYALPATSNSMPTYGRLNQLFIAVNQLASRIIVPSPSNTHYGRTFAVDTGNVYDGSVITYVPPSNQEQIIFDTYEYGITKLNVCLLDGDGNLVSLNGSEWSFVLRIE